MKIYELREFTYSWMKAKRWHKMNSTGAPTETSHRDIYSNLFPVTCVDTDTDVFMLKGKKSKVSSFISQYGR